jgi:hypothetical protein
VVRAAVLSSLIGDLEAKYLTGGELPLADYLNSINVQRRVLATIGLERRARDVTPTLDEYLQARGGRGSADEVDVVEDTE